jgi:hypothetical protein
MIRLVRRDQLSVGGLPMDLGAMVGKGGTKRAFFKA